MAHGLTSRLASWLYSTPVYAVTLPGRAPKALARLPALEALGDPAQGRRIIGGELVGAPPHRFAAPKLDWFDPTASPAMLAALHDFHYLPDLAAAGEGGRDYGRTLVASWLTSASRLHEVSWAPDVLGRRVAAWLSHAQFISARGDGVLGRDVLESLTRQVHHLARTVGRGRSGVARLAAIKGLIYGSACGIGSPRFVDRGLALLRRELPVQISRDGVHAGRSPAVQYEALSILVEIRAMLEMADISVPEDILHAIARLAPMLRFFRHGDGGLALFNGSTYGVPDRIDALLTLSRSKESPSAVAAAAGFQRLAAQRTLVIQDTGAASRPGFDACAHAEYLSFEMSDGPERIIVNCGAAQGAIGDALRTTAAHSTLIVEDVNSAEVLPVRGLGRQPTYHESERHETDGTIWVMSSHDGYRDWFGLNHRRRLYLSAAGDNLRGEDALIPAGQGDATARPFAVRFHLHPGVQVSVLQNGVAVLLRLPSGAGWRFQSAIPPRLEESVYFGDGEHGFRTWQISINSTTEGTGTIVKWAFQKL